MRFAITAVDRSLNVLDGLLAEGWQAVKMFTVPTTGPINVNRAAIARALKLDIPVQISRMEDSDLSDLARRGCDVLVCASYDWRIGDWRPHLKYAVNFHASPLPVARGPYPAFRAILEGRQSWGVSCHKIEHRFDAGDILSHETFPLSAEECHESLGLKTQMAFGRLARRVAKGLPKLWEEARVQGRGRYWPLTPDKARIIDFSAPVATTLRQVRAFGQTETIARMKGMTLYVRRAVGWTEPHQHPPGTVVHTQGRRTVVAALDGYIGLIEWSPITVADTEAIGRTIPPD